MGLITKLNLSSSCDFGSQMSQYASLIAVGKKTGLIPFFVKETLNEGWKFPLNEPFNHKPLVHTVEEVKSITFKQIVLDIDKKTGIDKKLFYLTNKNYFIMDDIGSVKYFHEYENDIKNIFNFNEEIQKFCKQLLYSLKNEDEIAVSIHFRRGDYLTQASLNLSLNYYNEAINKIKQLFSNKKIKYLIFSNDLDWVKQNFKPNNAIYVESLTRFQDMCLMSLCDHNIIANSSFSWWGAYLNNNINKKIICPYNYVNDVRFDYINGNYFPAEWISLNVN